MGQIFIMYIRYLNYGRPSFCMKLNSFVIFPLLTTLEEVWYHT